MDEYAVRGRLLVPREDGGVDCFADGLLAVGEDGRLVYVGAAEGFEGLSAWSERGVVRASAGVMLPPLLDIHTHISQYRIRGHFTDGVPDDAAEGKLLAGLKRNVFPEELRCAEEAVARGVVEAFLRDTLAHGVVGGAAFMTSSPVATRVALEVLPASWRVGLVLMNQHCLEGLRTDESAVEREVRALVERFGDRVIVTDRFAVATGSGLRAAQSRLAGELGLRTQTHLNEQLAEKRFVEETLYPGYDSYTEVYLRDGLLDHRCILAHCIYMGSEEWRIVRETGSVVAHCPTSNLLLGSGVMPLDEVLDRGIPYALATDVGASPTVSMLAEMGRFLSVHAGRSSGATACEALVRSTLVPAGELDLLGTAGRLVVGLPASWIEARMTGEPERDDAESVVRALLPSDLDEPGRSVGRVTLGGEVLWKASEDGEVVGDA